MVGGLPSVGWANGSKALAAAMVVWCDEIFLNLWFHAGLFGTGRSAARMNIHLHLAQACHQYYQTTVTIQ